MSSHRAYTGVEGGYLENVILKPPLHVAIKEGGGATVFFQVTYMAL